jgi:putative ABC transport system permease protein
VSRRLLSGIGWLVPASDRAGWQREWLAEFEGAEQDRRAAGQPVSAGWRRARVWAACRHAVWLRWESLHLETVGQDVRHGWRGLRRRPGFAVAAVLTLALGVGGTTVIFSTVRAVLWRPLPFPSPDRLVLVGLVDTTTADSDAGNSVSPPDFVDYERQATAFSGMAAIRDDGYALTGDGLAEQISGHAVTRDFFALMGVPAALGRTLGAADGATGAPEVVVLSDHFWRAHYGGQANVIGRRIVLDGVSDEVVGVMPASFDYPIGVDVWTPLRFTVDDLTTQRGAHYLTVVARLSRQATETQARAEMAGIGRRLAAAYPKNDAHTAVTVVPLRRAIVGDVAPAMRVLLAAVILVFLVACINVASLVMGAGLDRGRDLAVRAALGAGRGRLVRGLLVESVLLAAIGGAVGIALAAAGVRAVAGARAVGIPLLDQTAIDGTVVLFTLAATTLAAMLFGILPAVVTSRRDGSRGLSGAGVRTTGSRGTSRARDVLVAGELAMAVALLIGAGLLARSFVALTRVPLGLEPDHVQTASVSLPEPAYHDPSRRAVFVEDVLARLSAQGDVEQAAGIFGLPLTDFSYYFNVATLDGVKPPAEPGLNVELRLVTPGLFSTIRAARVAGRDFAPTDRRGTAPVALVNQRAARLLWPRTDPLGHRVALSTRLGLGGAAAGGEVIGVVEDIRDSGPASPPRPTVYLSDAQFPMDFLTLVVRPRGTSTNLVGTVRQVVAAVDPTVPVFETRTLEDVAAKVVAQPRFYLELVGLFASVAIVLAAVGIYGVMAQNVGARTREIGIRLALGATPGTAVGLILRQAGVLTVGGLASGLLLALAGRHLVAGLLFGVQPVDGLTLAAAGAATFAVALLAAWLPARRAARVDPVATLRAN